MANSWLSLLPSLIFIVVFVIATWRYSPGVVIFLGIIFAMIGFATIMGS